MGAFRPARRVGGPAGKEWEIYVLRYRSPERRPGEDYGFEDDFIIIPRLFLASALMSVLSAIYHDILVPVISYPFVTAMAMLRGRRETTVWLEAICWDLPPYREHIVWSTTKEHAARVLDEIAAGLAAGNVAEPLGARLESRSSE
jgi:hypothetical protein